MSGLFSRLCRLARANLPDPDSLLRRFRKTGGDFAFEGDAAQGNADDGFNSGFQAGGAGFSKQTVEDLAVFNLAPPSSLEAVRRARNREIRKFHSDRFMNDAEKLKTATQIMQIYNAAYERLETYFNKSTAKDP